MEEAKRPRGRPRSQFKESSAGTLQSLDRALGVLAAVAAAERATLSDLARAIEVPTATTHRILTTLQNHGFVAFDEDRQEWTIGIEAYRTGMSFLKRNSLIEVGQPILRRLMQQTGETANLAVPDRLEVVFVAQIETQNPIRAFFPAGARTPMHASGTGKAILAATPDAALVPRLRDAAFERFTGNTHADRNSLMTDLLRIRRRGWSFDREERYAGMSCIGAAIHDQTGAVCAGISVSGPSARLTPEKAETIAPLLIDAAAELTRKSGGVPPDVLRPVTDP